MDHKKESSNQHDNDNMKKVPAKAEGKKAVLLNNKPGAQVINPMANPCIAFDLNEDHCNLLVKLYKKDDSA
eukprot:scaffold420_cov169-Ochromonas_danica.AAC.19